MVGMELGEWLLVIQVLGLGTMIINMNFKEYQRKIGFDCYNCYITASDFEKACKQYSAWRWAAYNGFWIVVPSYDY